MPRITVVKADGKVYEMMRFIVRCDLCGDVIETISSKHTVKCVCENLLIRGGTEEGGVIVAVHDLLTDLSKWRLVE